jgi:phospholipid/cholesterol/gamma-HCH transport system substrate-binding protein
MPSKSREIRVGLLILTALAVLAAGVFLIGDKNNLFGGKSRYYIEFSSVSGLKPGNPVQLDGVDVGAVEKVVLAQDPRMQQIRIWIQVDRQYAERIRGPLGPAKPIESEVPSRARIKTLGLLGDKFIEINSGSPRYPVIADGEEIPAANPTNVDALIASGEDVMSNVVEISSSLSKILDRMERGEGLLGELTSNSPSGQRLKNSLIGTSETLQRVALKLETGDGPLPRLLNDREMAAKLDSSLSRFESLLAKAEGGEGLLPGLLNDPATRTQFNDTLAKLNEVAQDLQSFTADLETSDALLPRLVKDEEYGREVTEQVRQIVERLNEISRKLSTGEGTASKLINDPQIYDAVNDVIIGVNESRVLRWLLRNRQNKGIEKRYEDTKQEMEEAGREVPPLLDPATPPAPEPPVPAEPPPADEPSTPPPGAAPTKGT